MCCLAVFCVIGMVHGSHLVSIGVQDPENVVVLDYTAVLFMRAFFSLIGQNTIYHAGE